MIAILEAENQQKVDRFKPVYLRKYRSRWKKFVVFEHTINHLFLVMMVFLSLAWYFSFFYSFKAIYFKATKRANIKLSAVIDNKKD